MCTRAIEDRGVELVRAGLNIKICMTQVYTSVTRICKVQSKRNCICATIVYSYWYEARIGRGRGERGVLGFRYQGAPIGTCESK